MNDIERRRARLAEVSKRGIDAPMAVYHNLEKATPDHDVREWRWWAHVWDRPSMATWSYDERYLSEAQAQWDKDRAFVTIQLERAAERDARKAAEQAELRAETEAEKLAREEALTEHLRRAYLSEPGTTEEGFAAALPDLLEQRARTVALASGDAPASPLSASEILRTA